MLMDLVHDENNSVKNLTLSFKHGIITRYSSGGCGLAG